MRQPPTVIARREDGSRRRVGFAIPIPQLEVEAPWRVGQSLLLPAGWISTTVTTSLRHPKTEGIWRQYIRETVKPEAERVANWSTLCVPAARMEVADSIANDTIAALRLFQRSRSGSSLRRQTFGLAGDLTYVRRDYFGYELLPSGRPSSTGMAWQSVGFLAGWKFTVRDMRAYRGDPAFKMVDLALRSRKRTELQDRVVRAIRVLSQATASLDPPVEAVLLVMAYELLLGVRGAESQRHPVCQRVALSTCIARCGRDGVPPCQYLMARSQRSLVGEIKRIQRSGQHGLCSAYLHTDEAFELRNQVLHDSVLPAAETTSHLSWRMDRFLLTFLAEAAQKPAILSEMDATLPVPPK